MLVLTRRLGEVLRIADCISLTILRIEGNQVRIGVEAPSAVQVHREEVYLRLTSLSKNERVESEKSRKCYY